MVNPQAAAYEITFNVDLNARDLDQLRLGNTILISGIATSEETDDVDITIQVVIGMSEDSEIATSQTSTQIH